MLKYNDIINKLSDNDKIRILCDIKALSDKNYRALGIPEINAGELSALCGDIYPSPTALSNTWNTELVGAVADDLFKRAAAEDMGLVKIPGPRVKINPYRRSLSDDTVLSVAMSREYLKASGRAQIAAGLGGFGLYNDEIEWLDDEPDERFINEYIFKPYMDAAEGIDCAAVFTEPDVSADNYASVNYSLMEKVSNGNLMVGASAVCSRVASEKTVHYLSRGGLFFEGSPLMLESALSRYKQLMKKIEHGGATVDELQEEVSRGKAISPEMLDEAVDRLLDFVNKVKRRPNLSLLPADKGLAERAAEESIVLLKNLNKRLPLKKSSRVALIGDIVMADKEHGGLASELAHLLNETGYPVPGTARGYDLSLDRGEDMLEDAVDLAKSSDVVLLFLGFNEKRASKLYKERKLSIPANQQKLLDALGGEKDKVVAIIPSDSCVDICFPENCAAIVTAPVNTSACASALLKILIGVTNPSGKLADTVYFNTQKRYLEYRSRRYRDNMKVGSFIGYRGYDPEDDFEGFPFGHGLSYTHFSYSALTVANNTVSFTVKNDGSLDGAEVAQLYVGLSGSRVVRPLKELCGFIRIELRAGEKKTVQLPLKLPKIYSVESESFVEELGEYTVYVGSSVSDIRLSQKVQGGSATVESDGKRLSDYIYSESNVDSDNFKLEAKLKTMKKSIFNIVSGAVALVLAIVLKLYCASNGLDSMFFDIFAVALGIAGIVFFIREAVRRGRVRSEERAKLDELNDEVFEGSEKIPEYEAKKMFVEEFDVSDETQTNETEEHVDGVDVEYLRYIDKNLNFELAATEFERFALERGCKFRSDMVKKVFAALASSRLLVVEGMNDKDFKTLMLLLSNYFESPLFIDRVDQGYISTDSVLFRSDAQGNRVKTNVNYAIEAAKNSGFSIQLAGLTNVSGANMHLYFSSYVNYVKNPLANNHVSVLNERNIETTYYLPKNVWFVLNLAENESAADLPDFVSEVSSVNLFDLSECPASEQHTPVHKFSYYQMDWLSEKTASGFAVDEDLWKKIDRFEEYVASQTEFHIGNKLWLCLERFAYVYMACGGEQIDAVDEAVAAKLMVPVLYALKDSASDDERSLDDVLDTVFGEDRAEACKNIVKACDAAKKAIEE